MADYRYNFDHRCDDERRRGPSYNQVIDVIFNEESSGDELPLIPLAEVKNFCKIDVDEDDALLNEIQLAAIQICEGAANIGLRQRSITAILNNGNGGCYLPYGPIAEVTLIDKKAPETDQVLGVTWKQIDWPIIDRVEVEYIGGYPALPYRLKLALLQCIFYLYDERKRRDDPYPPIYIETLKQFSRK